LPPLSSHNAALLASLIDDLPCNLRPTWKDVCLIAARQFNHTWTRQWLAQNSSIKKAYKGKLKEYKEFRVTGKAPRYKAPEDEVQRKRIARQDQEIATLKRTLSEYDQRFVLYMANAIKYGLTIEQMLAPLTPVNRGQTDPVLLGSRRQK
jgi:hypothetical protein